MQQAAVREPLPPPEQIEQLTREVLARPEFQPAVGDRAGEIFWDLVRGVFGGLLDWSAANPGQARLLSWLITLALGLLLAYLLAGLLANRDTGGSRVLRLPLEASRSWKSLEGQVGSWEEAMEKARAALASGNPYQALWIAHRTLLALLDYRGLIQFAKWKTNGDYLRECPRESALFGLLDSVTGAYDQVVYAHGTMPARKIGGILEEIDRERAHGKV